MTQNERPTLPQVLSAIHTRRLTGLLEVQGEGVVTILYFANGRLVFAEAGTLGATLGRLLVRDGKLTEEQYAKVIEAMTSALVDNETVRFGEVAITLGFLTSTDVQEALVNQVRQKAVHCLQWESPDLRFLEGADTLEGLAHFPSNTLALVMEGIRRFYDPARLETSLSKYMGLYLRRAADSATIGEGLELKPMEARIVQLIDGKLSTHALLERSPIDRIYASQILVALISTGMVQATEDPLESIKPKAAQSETHENHTAQHAQIAAQVQTEVDPAERARQRAAQIAKQLRQRQKGQRQTRSAFSSAPPPDETRARLEAEQAFERGRRQMGYNAWPAAVKEFHRAAKYCPDFIEYKLYLTFAELRAAETDEATEALRAKLEEIVPEALKKDREMAFAWHVAGQLALLEGDEEKALKAFQVAIRNDKKDNESARYVRLLESRKS